MRHRYTKELLEPIIKESINWSQVCIKLGIAPMSGSQGHAKKRAVDFGIDFSHFTGSAWNKGKTLGPKRKIEEYLSNEASITSDRLKKRLFKEGIKDKKCEKCDLVTWYGKPAPLELDHINGNHFDNRLENLQVLCSNCHSTK